MTTNKPFKICPACQFAWNTRNEFIADSNIEIIGYQANFQDVSTGLFLFNHNTCKGTLAIATEPFLDLYQGPTFSSSCTGTPSCPEYCLHRNRLEPCSNLCEYAFVREIIQILKNK